MCRRVGGIQLHGALERGDCLLESAGGREGNAEAAEGAGVFARLQGAAEERDGLVESLLPHRDLRQLDDGLTVAGGIDERSELGRGVVQTSLFE